ncbi:MAG: substrate-binding domain-containing protein [Epibacterium sp.]|nr:substrate-binding domain-containing protein [Epibacterium sp.]NQX74850.1 substrate-binding domain-containing protein [Epibacterium sp.]
MSKPPVVLVLSPWWAQSTRALQLVLIGLRERLPGFAFLHECIDSPEDVDRVVDLWQPISCIALRLPEEHLEALVSHGLPLVQIFGGPRAPQTPMIDSDAGLAASLAATAFSRQQIRGVGFIGVAGADFSEARCKAFRSEAQRKGLTIVFEHDVKIVYSEEDQLRDDLAQLIAPQIEHEHDRLGIWCANDATAFYLVTACHQHGIPIPDRVAVIGHDDDPVCLNTVPCIATIAVPHLLIGHQVGDLLVRCLDGESIGDHVLVAPIGVVERSSIDALASSDPTVAAAIGFIRRHFRRSITVEDICNAANCSRRVLEKRMRSIHDTSIARVLRQTRFSAACLLLADSDIALAEIARRTGFTSASHLSRAFADFAHCTPQEWKQQRTH